MIVAFDNRKETREYEVNSQKFNNIRIKLPTRHEAGQVVYRNEIYTIKDLLKSNDIETFFEHKTEVTIEDKVIGTIEPKYKINKTIWSNKPETLYYKFIFNEEEFKIYEVVENKQRHICIYRKEELVGLIERNNNNKIMIYSVYFADILPFSLILLYFDSMRLLKNKKIIKNHQITSYNNKDKYDFDFKKRIIVLDKVS